MIAGLLAAVLLLAVGWVALDALTGGLTAHEETEAAE